MIGSRGCTQHRGSWRVDPWLRRPRVYLIESELTTGITLKIDGGHALV